MAVQKADYIWRDFNTDGVPASGAAKPKKREIREKITWVESFLAGIGTNGGFLFTSQASLFNNLNYPASTIAWVIGDPDPAKDGIYQKLLASGTGSWVWKDPLPYSVLYAQNDNSGTANAVVATSSLAVVATSYSQLISVPFTAANTGAMTLAINGETPRPLVTNTGESIPAGYITAGMSVLVQIDGAGNYRLFSYGDAAAIQAAAEAAQSAAEAARDEASTYDPTFRAVSIPALLASTRVAGGEGVIWQAGSYLYREAASAASDHDLTTAGGVKLYVLPNADGSIHSLQFGVIGDGVADDTAAMAKFGASTVSRIKRLKGQPKITAELSFNIVDQVEGDGYDTVIDGSSITSFTGLGGIVKTDGSAGLVRIADLAGNVTKGNVGFSLVDASDVVIGDWLCLSNPTNNSWLPAPFPYVYRAGEWCRVIAVDYGTGVVNVFRPLWRSYVAGDMQVYRLRSGRPSFRNFRIKAPALQRAGLYVDCAIDPVIENVWPEGSLYAAIRIQRSINPYLNCNLFGMPETGAISNEYAVQLGSVCGGEIHGSYFAMRHGVSFGGDDFPCMVPNRETRVFANTAGPVSQSLDVGGHGCSEGLIVEGGVHAGLSTGGANMTFNGATFRIGPRGFSQTSVPPVAYSEGKGGDFVFNGCIFEGFANKTGNDTLISLFLQAGNDEGPRFHFNNCIYKDAGGNSYPIRVLISGTTVKPEIYVNGGWVGMAAFVNVVQVQKTGGGVSAIGAVVVRDVAGLPTNATLIGNGSTGTLSIDKKIGDKGVTQSGKATVTVTSSTSGTVAITFPQPYDAAPIFVPSVKDTVGTWAPTYLNLTATGATIKITDTTAASRSGDVEVEWIAMPAS